jgi:hypothetical protein
VVAFYRGDGKPAQARYFGVVMALGQKLDHFLLLLGQLGGPGAFSKMFGNPPVPLGNYDCGSTAKKRPHFQGP